MTYADHTEYAVIVGHDRLETRAENGTFSHFVNDMCVTSSPTIANFCGKRTFDIVNV